MLWTTVQFLLGGFPGSVFVGFVLWKVLPQGVALSSSPETHEADCWRLTNTSSVPAQFISVVHISAGWGVRSIEPWDANDVIRDPWTGTQEGIPEQWSDLILMPGQCVEVHAHVNSHVDIEYQRADRLFGRFERRTVRVVGFV